MMKRLLSLILTVTLALTLAACIGGENPGTGSANAGNTQNTQAGTSESVHLVESYSAKALGNLAAYFSEYRMEFQYNEDLTGGTAAFTTGEDVISGTFTCDENHNITAISFAREEEQLSFAMTFDDSHRLLSAVIRGNNGEEEQLLYSVTQTYNDQGKPLRIAYEVPRFERASVVENVYNQQGILIGQTNRITMGGQESETRQAFVYDENGFMTAMEQYDADGSLLMSIPLTAEDGGDRVTYTCSMDDSTMTLAYDKQGNCLLQEMYTGDTLTMRIENTYNEKGNQLSSTQYYAATNQTTRTEYVYDEAGHLLEHKQYSGDELIGWITTTYITKEP